MKRNNNTVREGRRTKAGGKSRYAAKVAKGGMMYGPGCCGHRLNPTSAEMARRRRENGVGVYHGFSEQSLLPLPEG